MVLWKSIFKNLTLDPYRAPGNVPLKTKLEVLEHMFKNPPLISKVVLRKNTPLKIHFTIQNSQKSPKKHMYGTGKSWKKLKKRILKYPCKINIRKQPRLMVRKFFNNIWKVSYMAPKYHSKSKFVDLMALKNVLEILFLLAENSL